MSSFRALLRADTRLSSLRPRASSRPPRSNPTAIPHCLRFNSSVSAQTAPSTSPESTPAIENAHRSLIESDIHQFLDPEVIHDYKTENKSTNANYQRLRQLSDEVLQNQKDVNLLQGQIHRLRRGLRATQKVVEGGPWLILKNWNFNPHPGKEEVTFENGFLRVGQRKIPNMWLRDNCQCSSCIHGDTKQRLLDTFSIPENISIKTCAEFRTYMDVTWSDGHRSQYDKELLNAAVRDPRSRAEVRQGYPDRIFTWGSEIANNKPTQPWLKPGVSTTTFSAEGCKTDDDLILHVLHKIRRYGFCYISNVDATPEATENLLQRIAFIRETHYGGFYDFTADLAKADTAYTNIALPAHTDNTYFSDPAGLQAFHLLSHTEGEGGASLLVDGFKAAETLLAEDKDAYHVLATVNVHAHASGNAGISIQPYRGFPVLEHDVDTGNLLRVRWNTSDRAGIELPVEDVDKWYAAARKFDAILKRKENEYWEQLQPGTVLVFDNWRVLHGRSEFTGKRRICGAYINRDDWISRWKMLHFGKEEVLGKLATS
ncbi:Trimethyllysine dioxygenase [Paraphaeosphaeria sporulosa]|uniref:Trimethyllysine dioxygenase n=1 Tax=Paraphaeosphaeria sporulosa TaxID=1460663 RepID=A0A177CKG0_9PLEO|nr:Trimethyllysine dioxygenase [Paraphaeosphaeria sporulosa]OAG08024.1 Trimethyllysine dioxygenase [Paraphaeosphaeria sporulosa]